MLKINCPICNDLTRESFTGSDEMVENVQPAYKFKKISIFDRLDLKLCDSCAFAFAYPYLDGNALDHFYSESYIPLRFRSQIIESQFKSKITSAASLERVWLINSMVGNPNPNKALTILDFGGSDGAMANLFKNYYKNSQIYVDDNKKYVDCWRMRGVEYRNLREFEDNSIDLIYVSHCFEHIPANHLKGLVDLMHKKIKKNGFLYAEVPNENFFEFEKNYKIQYIAGPHLSHFSLASLQKLFASKFKLEFSEIRGKINGYGINRIHEKNTTNIKSSRNSALSFYAHKIVKGILRRLNYHRILILKKILLKILNKNQIVIEVPLSHSFHKNECGDILIVIAKK